MANLESLDAVELIRRLISVSTKLSDRRPLHLRMTDLCHETGEFLGCDRVSIMVWDGGAFRARYNWGNPPDIAAWFPSYRVPRDAPLVAEVFDGPDDFIVVNDAKRHPALTRISRTARIESLVMAAMYGRDGEELGFMTAEYNERLGRFDRWQAEVVLGLAKLAQAAILFDREWQHRLRLSNELHTALDDERRRLGRDIHDDPLQRVFAIGSRLTALRNTTADPTTQAALDELITQCSAATAALRGIATDTHPATADATSIVRSLDRLVARHAVDGAWTYRLLDQGIDPLDAPTAVLLLRIADQALLNVVLHAQATNVTVDLIEDDGGVRLTITDDGVGFDHGARHRDRLGLVSMREHAVDAGGKLTIASAPGAGTRVELWLPR